MLLLKPFGYYFLGEWVRFLGGNRAKNTGKEINFIVWNKRLSVMFSLQDQIHLDSEWLFTVVFEIWELKLWQM